MTSLPSPYNHGTGYFSAAPVHSQDSSLRAISPDNKKETVRKRPKYTRSKMGCLTCRTKKVKCDEIKPMCTRCVQGQRECTWPEIVPPRKKSTSKKQSSDERPSTADSERLSSSSSPPLTREQSPRSRSTELGLTLPPRSDLSLQMPNSSSGFSAHRRSSTSHHPYLPPSHQFSGPPDPVLHPIPELQHPYSNSNLHGHSMNHATSHPGFYSPTSSSSGVSHASSIPRPHESTLPPLDLSRFPGPPMAQLSWQSAPVVPLDSDSYVRHQNFVGRVQPHSSNGLFSVPYHTAKDSDGSILQPVRVW